MSELNNINSSILINPLTCRVFTSINHFYIFGAVNVMSVQGVWGAGQLLQETEAKTPDYPHVIFAAAITKAVYLLIKHMQECT